MTSFWNVAKTKRRNGDVVVDNSSKTFHRFLFSVFSRNSFSTDRRYRTEDSSARATPPLPPPPLLGPSSFRPSTFFSGSGPNSRPETSSVFSETCYNLLFCLTLSFPSLNKNRERGKNSRFFWFRFGYFFSGGRRHLPEPRPFKSFGALRTFFMADCRDVRWLLRSDADKPNLKQQVAWCIKAK